MKLVKQDIRNIDEWLKRRGIKYVDIRYELIDHLVAEYETMDNYPDLESFLSKRIAWCTKVAKQKQRTVNFGITKALFRKFLSFFTNIKSIVILIIIGFSLVGFDSLVSGNMFRKTLFGLFFVPVFFEIYLVIFSGFGSRLKKESVSVAYLMNLFLLPILPINFLGRIPEDLLHKPSFFAPLFLILILLHISAILVFYEKRKKLLKEFEVLKEQFA